MLFCIKSTVTTKRIETMDIIQVDLSISRNSVSHEEF